jgi:pyruvate carboxylase subunit B
VLGKVNWLPGKLAFENVELAEKQGREIIDWYPQDHYPDLLYEFRKEMDENGWEYCEDDEELMEFAMVLPQCRN